MGTILFQNVTGKSDQSIMYVCRFSNKVKHNYNTIEKNIIVMVVVLHKFTHYLLDNKFIFYVSHMTLVYSVNQS
jgi:hypothetical protein